MSRRRQLPREAPRRHRALLTLATVGVVVAGYLTVTRLLGIPWIIAGDRYEGGVLTLGQPAEASRFLSPCATRAGST